jgi:hypothetical protein
MCACFVYMHTCMNKETMKHRHLHEYFPWDDQPTSFTPAIAIAIFLLYCVGLWLCAPRCWSRTHKHDSFRTVIILIPGHGDTDTKSHGVVSGDGGFLPLACLGIGHKYIFLDNEVDITLSCNCYQVPPSFDRAGTHTHSTDRKDRPWILPGPLSIIRSMAGWQLIRQGCWQMGTAGLGWRQRLREKLEMLEIALEFNWRVGRATRLNLPRTLDLDKLTLRTRSALHLF